MVEYLAGNRIIGTDSERVSTTTMSATGGTITTNTSVTPNKTVHTFTSGGTFEITSGSGDVEYLVISGGGGGGGSASGAGGGGNVWYNTANRGTGTYTVTVGGGGGGGVSGGSGGDGGDSTFDTITASGLNTRGTSVGGSTTVNISGTSTTYTGGIYPSGGGAGASQNGFDRVSTALGGAGGNGYTSSITGTAICRAGGGGGGLHASSGTGGAGACGGSNGVVGSGSIVGGTANYGGGGGSGGGVPNVAHGSGSVGGSGIVILSYAPEITTNLLTNVVDGSIFYAKDTNKEYVLNSNTWTEV